MMTEAPSYRHYGDEDLDPVLETSVVDLTKPEAVSSDLQAGQQQAQGVGQDHALPGKCAVSAEEIARSQAVAWAALDEVEAMLKRNPTQQGGENNE